MSDREKVINCIKYCINHPLCIDCDACNYGGKTSVICDRLIQDTLALLEEQLDDSDRIKVVRCSECQYWQPPTYAEQEDGSTIGHCTAALNGQQTDAYWFCADGTR